MRRPKRLDLFSLVIGILAVALGSFAVHLRSIRVPGAGNVLNWLDRLGLVNHAAPRTPSVIAFDLPSPGTPAIEAGRVVAVTGVPELSDAGYLPINDDTALLGLFALVVILALAAMFTAVWAEFRHQPTLYLSVGYICGSLAIAQIWLIPGFVCVLVGVAAVLILRNQGER